MSIVIKGLSCPKSCLECKFRRSYSADSPWEECFCMVTFDRITFIEQKLDNCPIEPLDMIDKAPTVNQWISVKDRLPEKEGEYLCYRRSLNDGYCELLRYGVIYNKGRKRTFYFFDSEYGDVEANNVTHWMELPEPPKEIENETNRTNTK